jgi:hypothetical protein
MLFLSKSSGIMRYLAILFITLFIYPVHLSGQAREDSSLQTGVLSLRIKSITFVKDNEYFNPIGASKFMLVSSLPGFVDKSAWNEGYTLIGYFVQPELIYSPSSRVTLRAGTYLLKYAGKDNFSRVLPVFSASLKITDKTTLTMGTLSGSDSHKLYDPNYDSERLYRAYNEEGVQLTGNYKHIFNDTYLSWENFIFEADSTREIINFGESFRYTSPTLAGFLHFEIPVQMQFKHFGGQISNYPQHMETYFNLSAGLGVNMDIAQKRYGVAGVEYMQFMNDEFPGKPPSGITNGYASWFRFHYTYKGLYIGAAYWKAHNYFAPNGNSIYGSVVNNTSDYVISDRKIITNTVYLTLFPLKYLEFFIGMETYYDVPIKNLDYAISLHMNFDKLIRLANLKN